MTPARLIRIVRQRVASVTRSARLDRDLDRELAFHLDSLIEEKIADGLAPDAARREARRSIGNLASVRDACRDQRAVGWFDDIGPDLRYGLRMLAASPAFTAVALLSLALGIGANAAVLGVTASVRHDSLPLPDPDRVVMIRSVSKDNPANRGVSPADYLAWKERSRAFAAIELSLSGPRDLGDEGDHAPAERTTGQAVSSGFFQLLGVEPMLGRVFTPDEARSSARVVILSHGLWQRRYGGDPGILNRQVPVDNGRSTVIGIMPADYTYRNLRIDFWSPLHIPPSTPPGGGRLFGAIARLKPDVAPADGQRELENIAAQLATERPVTNAGWSVQLTPLREELFGWTRAPLANLRIAVGLVLLMACANLAALLLARGTVRRREIAVRVVLGAGRNRIVRQLLTESLLLSLGGGALGLLVAWAGVHILSAMIPPLAGAPLVRAGLDLRVLSAAAALSIGTGLLFGLAPALTISRIVPGASLESLSPLSAQRHAAFLRRVLVSAQVALALWVLIGFGLLVNSHLRLTHRNLNFEPSGLLMFEARTHAPQRPLGRVAGFTHFEMLNTPSQAMTRIHEQLAALPDVKAVGGISFPPVDSLILPIMDVRLDRVLAAPDAPFRAAYFLVTPGLFAAIGTPFIRGRDVTAADTVARPWVAIVNESAARQFWPGQDPIGRHLTIDVVEDERPREVIGIVPDIPTRHGQLEAQPVIYASYLQQPSRYRGPFGGMFGQMTFMVRHPTPLSLVPAVRKAVAAVEPRPISSVMTGETRRGLGTERARYDLSLLGMLAATASILAAIGVYGLLTYSVSARTREIGIRKALGAGSHAVLMFIGADVAVVLLAGLLLGCLGARLFSRVLASQLWGITPTDPLTYVAGAVLVVLAGLLACLGPARRAVGVDPTTALRAE